MGTLERVSHGVLVITPEPQPGSWIHHTFMFVTQISHHAFLISLVPPSSEAVFRTKREHFVPFQ